MQKRGKHIYLLFIKSKFLLLIVFASIIQSCSTTKHLKEVEKLLSKVKIKYEDKAVYQVDLLSISKQKPNRKLLGVFKLYLGVYNLYYNKENSKIKNNIGEAPIIFDSTLVENSAELMHKYLKNRGYYKNEVNTEVVPKRKKVKLKYIVKAGNQYQINLVNTQIKDPKIEAIYENSKNKSYIKEGEPFDIELMNKERKRVEKTLNNKGYFKFSKEFVLFEADTSNSNEWANITTVIKDRPQYNEAEDTTYTRPHKTFLINKVIVRLDYSNQRTSQLAADTSLIDEITFVEINKGQIRKDVLTGLIYIKPGDIYRQDLQELTYRNLSRLRVFSFVSITYDQDYQSNDDGLVAYIDLNFRKPKSYTIQSEGTNNGGNLGINGNISFQNNNTFRGAEILNVKVSGGLEAQQLLTEDGDDQNISGLLPFNTFEFGPEVNLEVPRFLLPIKSTKLSQKGNPRTTFNASFNLQDRPDYRRSVTKTFISYAWNETITKTHIIQPIDLSYIRLDPSAEFEKVLEGIRNPFLRNTYTDNLILASKYSFILNTQNDNRLKNHFYLRFNIESAGNFVSLFAQNANLQENEEGAQLIADVPFAQYMRSDFDFRYYQNFEFNSIVFRLASGVGLPYGNSSAMPFEKSFYAGGANGIRAWQARQLGPGNLPDSSTFTVDQIGNMSIEGNIEYRFGITKVLEGAAFIDAGNIWNLNQEDSRPDTQFEFSKLWRGTALGVGLGMRLNFTFFVFRLDFAAPIKDPAEENPETIKPQWGNTNLNFGIGYPF